MPATTNIGLNQPIIASNNWGGPLNYNFGLLDLLLSGGRPLPALAVTGNLTVGGTVTAGAFAGLDGTFLTSALFNQPNGIPQLNAAAKIPSSLLSSQSVAVVPFSATPVFNGANGGVFDITLTGNVSSSTFVNGLSGGAIVVFRIIQDGSGNRTFTWPTNVRNAGVISPAAGARSLQAFAIDTDGSLDAIGAMQYS